MGWVCQEYVLASCPLLMSQLWKAILSSVRGPLLCSSLRSLSPLALGWLPWGLLSTGYLFLNWEFSTIKGHKSESGHVRMNIIAWRAPGATKPCYEGAPDHNLSEMPQFWKRREVRRTPYRSLNPAHLPWLCLRVFWLPTPQTTYKRTSHVKNSTLVKPVYSCCPRKSIPLPAPRF